MERKCLQCGTPFQVQNSRANNDPIRGKYCSVKCRGLARRVQYVKQICTFCQKPYLSHPRAIRSRTKLGQLPYCSHLCAVRGRLSPTKERFWAQVEKPPDGQGCWLWRGYLTYQGYGKFSIRVNEKWQTTPAHRFSHEEVNGPILDDRFVLHHCDVPACVNPDHLYLGTQADNMADKVRRSRQARGAKNGNSVLTEEEVDIIRERLIAGEKQKNIAKDLNISKNVVSAIKFNKIWKHTLTQDVEVALIERQKKPRYGLLEDVVVAEIKARLKNGEKGVIIAAIYNIPVTTISRIKKNKAYVHVS